MTLNTRNLILGAAAAAIAAVLAVAVSRGSSSSQAAIENPTTWPAGQATRSMIMVMQGPSTRPWRQIYAATQPGPIVVSSQPENCRAVDGCSFDLDGDGDVDMDDYGILQRLQTFPTTQPAN